MPKVGMLILIILNPLFSILCIIEQSLVIHIHLWRMADLLLQAEFSQKMIVGRI